MFSVRFGSSEHAFALVPASVPSQSPSPPSSPSPTNDHVDEMPTCDDATGRDRRDRRFPALEFLSTRSRPGMGRWFGEVDSRARRIHGKSRSPFQRGHHCSSSDPSMEAFDFLILYPSDRGGKKCRGSLDGHPFTTPSTVEGRVVVSHFQALLSLALFRRVTGRGSGHCRTSLALALGKPRTTDRLSDLEKSRPLILGRPFKPASSCGRERERER